MLSGELAKAHQQLHASRDQVSALTEALSACREELADTKELVLHLGAHLYQLATSCSFIMSSMHNQLEAMQSTQETACCRSLFAYTLEHAVNYQACNTTLQKQRREPCSSRLQRRTASCRHSVLPWRPQTHMWSSRKSTATRCRSC